VTIRGARPTIADLGKRHPGYGVTDAHYDSVGAALLWRLEQGLGEAWTAAYALLAGVMREVANAANDMTAPTQRAVA
jgi:hemoglobin-like flavoprotein